MMEQLQDVNAGQGAGNVDSAVAKPAISVGKTLRQARESQGLSIADVSGKTKIVPRQIEALEADDFKHLPEMPFVRGFVRCYARLLNLDVEMLLAALPQAPSVPVQLKPASVEVPFPSAHSQRLQNMLWLGAALVVTVLLAVFAVWHFTAPPEPPEVAQDETQITLPATMQSTPASVVPEAGVMAASAAVAAAPAASQVLPATTQVAPAVSPVVTAQPLPVPAKPAEQPAQTVMQLVQLPIPEAKPPVAVTAVPQAATLRLVFDVESWTEVEDKSGKVISSQLNPRGSELRLDGRAPFSLIIGHAPSVRLFYRGKQVDLKPHINASSEVARLKLE